MGDISKNFSTKEFFTKDTYQKIVSAGKDPVELIDFRLVNVLQKIRNHFGKRINIHRAFSTMAENLAIDGAALWSQHQYGRACDFDVEGVSSDKVIGFAKTIQEVKAYGKIDKVSVHVDVRDTRDNNKIEIKY